MILLSIYGKNIKTGRVLRRKVISRLLLTLFREVFSVIGSIWNMLYLYSVQPNILICTTLFFSLTLFLVQSALLGLFGGSL